MDNNKTIDPEFEKLFNLICLGATAYFLVKLKESKMSTEDFVRKTVSDAQCQPNLCPEPAPELPWYGLCEPRCYKKEI